MQYTGLKDAYDKEIYEEDILLNEDDHVKFVVKWSEEHACFYCKQLFEGREDNFDDFEEFGFIHADCSFPLSLGMFIGKIIGNTLENPELLK